MASKFGDSTSIPVFGLKPPSQLMTGPTLSSGPLTAHRWQRGVFGLKVRVCSTSITILGLKPFTDTKRHTATLSSTTTTRYHVTMSRKVFDPDNPLEPMTSFLHAFHRMARNRLELERVYGQIWNEEEMLRDFEVLCRDDEQVIVNRKSDCQEGVLSVQDEPRFYFCFIESLGILLDDPAPPDTHLTSGQLGRSYHTPGNSRYRTRPAYSCYPGNSLCNVRSSKNVRTIRAIPVKAAGTSAQYDPSARAIPKNSGKLAT